MKLPHLPTHWESRLVEVLLVFLVAAIIVRVGRRVIGRLEGIRAPADELRRARRSTLYRLLTSGLRYLVDFIALIMALDLFGIPTGSLLAGAGILGLAVGFGAQGLVQDLVTGLFILYEDQYAVGDQITLPALSLSGTVMELGIRITRLRGTAGEEIILPNRLVLEVQNHSRQATSVSVNVPIAPDFDPEAARRTFQHMVDEVEHEIPGVNLLGVVDIQPGAVVWAVSAPVQYATTAKIGYQLREVVARTIYQAGLPLAGNVKGTGWTSPGTK
ncbi:MAG: mechanosensitive ion channel family protein [Firmicutes bacterium]|nr:mechanosensitive ion channel family protein [Bacillota bacterium]